MSMTDPIADMFTRIRNGSKAKKIAEKLLRDSYNLIKNMKNNDILLEFVNMIKDRLP